MGQHPNIELINYAEVEEINGFVGNFVAKVRVRAKSVDYEKCTGCGACIAKCPKRVPSEFDEGIAKRKSIYTDFPQAVPNKPVIDRASCVYFAKGTCKACEKACETDAIDFEQKDVVREIEVGAVILATGFDLYDVSGVRRLGLGRLPNVLTGLQFERLLNAAGPTGGDIKMADGKPPKSVAIAHCIGSRDKKHREYCSRVCCMAALKFAHLIKERLHDCEVTQFYIDMRCFGKGYEEFYNRIQDEGVKFIRGKVSEISDKPFDDEEQDKLIVISEDTMLNKVVRLPVDMVVLMPALVPRHDSERVAQLLKCSRSSDGFILEKHPKLAPVQTSIDGVYIAGACQAPKDIPDTVAQGSAAASQAIGLLARGKVEVEAAIADQDNALCSGCGLCVEVCPFGAITYDDEKRKAVFNSALCKGCGTCTQVCTAGCITARHFTVEQVLAQITGALSV
ncbi:MAG: CoB--CoM heterodisulfide reductase iron-sulfur subunit A family protein [Deltaproteobacteria bacterium]|nr:CoB--CoM heterodisulfide reductase iron-sulfur subunit A family protein [Deltaproteobacteria bacterium]